MRISSNIPAAPSYRNNKTHTFYTRSYSSKPKNCSKARTKLTSIKNIISMALLLMLCYGVKEIDCKKRHLCGSRLIDGLRFLCGARGFNSPVLQQGRFGLWTPHNSHRPYITEICCNQGCSLQQLEQFCDLPGHTMHSGTRILTGRRRSRKKGRKKSNKQSTTSTVSTTESISTTASLSPTSTALTTRNATRQKTNLVALEARYYSLIEQERASKSGGRSVLLDIIKTAAKLYHEVHERNGSGSYEDEYNSGTVKAHFAPVDLNTVDRPKRAQFDH